jgi:thiamine-phosphate pyrophosphorylase
MGTDDMARLQAQATIRRKLASAERRVRRVRRIARRKLPAAWFLTDPARTPDPLAIVRRLPRGWGVIYRSYGAPDRQTIARALAGACHRRGLVFLVSADPALARAVHADGVHWPEAQAPRWPRRPRRGWITQSAHSARSLARASRRGVDAALLSPVFASISPSAGPAKGLRRYFAMARLSRVPVLALGGVNADTAQRLASGNAPHAAGWAAIEGVLSGFGPSGAGPGGSST